MLNKTIWTSLTLLAISAGLYWYWTRPETPGYQGGMPAEVNPEIVESVAVTIDRQECLKGRATVKKSATVEVSVLAQLTDQYSTWTFEHFDFDFRPKVDNRVDWDAMRNVHIGYINASPTSQWKVHVAPGEYEFRLYVIASDSDDVTQPPQHWQIAHGQLLIQPE